MRHLLITLIAVVIVACGSEQESKPEPKVEKKEFTDSQLNNMYKTQCSICHGMDGKMGYAGSKDLTQSEMNIAQRKAIIKYGKGQMTPFEGRLNDAEIEAMAKYLNKFRE